MRIMTVAFHKLEQCLVFDACKSQFGAKLHRVIAEVQNMLLLLLQYLRCLTAFKELV